MYLSGAIKDLKNILIMADDLRATAIHFIAPHTVFILAQNKKDYVYVRTGLVIGYSMMMTKTTYLNLLTYVQASKKEIGNKHSIFYQKILTGFVMTPGKLLLDGSSQVLLDVDIPSFPLKKDVEFKLEDSIVSSYERNAPYLKMASEDLKKLQKHKAKVKKSTDNTIRIEDDQLVLYFSVENQPTRVETYIRHFSVNGADSLTFSDKALYLMCWLNKVTYSEEVILLPRQDYCVWEGYNEEMMIKVRTDIG